LKNTRGGRTASVSDGGSSGSGGGGGEGERCRKIAAEKGDLRAAGGGTIRREHSITLSRILIE